nr:EAL domain-containing protein [Sagittula salina]
MRSLRHAFGCEAAFISRFDGGQRVFDTVDGHYSAFGKGFAAGACGPLDESFCYRVAQGYAPRLVRDARLEPAFAKLNSKFEPPIGLHLSVPIRLTSGVTYGMLCLFGTAPRGDVTGRDLALVTLTADLLAQDIEDSFDAHFSDLALRLTDALDNGAVRFLLQPVVTLPERHTVGYELLSRFPATLGSTEDIFRLSRFLGVIAPMEARIAAKAREVLARLPREAKLSINFSVSTIETLDLSGIFPSHERGRVIIEITEHERVSNYDSFSTALNRLRGMGFRVAIDDVGAGYSTFRHVVQLRPDIIKMDRSLIAGIDQSRERGSLASALLDYSRENGVTLVAEGIETGDELAALEAIGVKRVQGYLTGAPRPLDEVLL